MELYQKIEHRLFDELKKRNGRLYIPHIVLLGLSYYFGRDIFDQNLWLLTPFVIICFSLISRELILNRLDQTELKKNFLLNVIFLGGVALSGLGWGIYSYFIMENKGVFSVEGIYVLVIITTLLAGGVTTLSASLKSCALFLTCVAIIPVFYLMKKTQSDSFIVGCVVLVNYLYHIIHAYQSNRHMKAMIKNEMTEYTKRSFLQEIMDALPGFVAILDKDQRFVMVNNYGEGQYREKILGKTLGNGGNPVIEKVIKEFIQSEKEGDIKEIHSTTRGFDEWFMLHMKKATQFDGTVVDILPVSEWVKTRNELKVQEAKAHYSAKLASLGEMAAGIAHEVNNPLTIIEGVASIMVQLLEEPEIDRPMIKQMGHKVMDTTQRIAKIIKSLKKLSRNSENEPFSEFSLNSILEPCLEISQQRIQGHQIELRLPESREDVVLLGREVELSQVLMNLISNAIDAVENQKERWIELRYETCMNWCDIYVVDSGPGIPVEERAKIMEPFYTTKEINQGTGLGLSISKTIVEGHRGELSFIEAPHTTFRMRLPKHLDFRSSVPGEEVHSGIH